MADKPRLGAPTVYPERYDPELLVALPRARGRQELALLPAAMCGADRWTAWELSWLDSAGKPQAAVGEFLVDCSSPCLVESKSFKLYLNSLNQWRFESEEAVRACLAADLQRAFGAPVEVRLHSLAAVAERGIAVPPGICLDDLAVSCERYRPDPALLALGEGTVEEEWLHSHLFKSNCPITGQPDWATVIVGYGGRRLDPAALLRYLVSFRLHRAFHEHCVEQIFAELHAFLAPNWLFVEARFTRRGGLDINPWRATVPRDPGWRRLARQ
ncbi:MAG: NADPH-dependent 7-cyano-7-deazaguanine reductase [Porticoccaceae bacterium]|nr:MAG: NADPH-dependent 7-cyano-7-deazaguanine reductase [Porticoccaceae bacterium]